MEYVMQHPAITRSILGRPLLDRNITHYSNSHQILLVGEGDFSFSLALANAFGSAENMVPTSLDSKEKVLQLYDCESTHKTLSNLERLGATILHGVDATTMENHHLLGRMRFHRIVYNFPHAGFHGREDNENVIEKHRHLLKMFFKNARTILRETGEIHVTHKAYRPYERWELVKQAEECGLRLKESVHFTIADYPGYTNRRGAGSKAGGTFNLGECRTYKFVLGSGLLYPQKLMDVQVALSNISFGASAKDFEAVVREPEPEPERGCQVGILNLRDLKGKRGCQVGILNLRDLNGKRGCQDGILSLTDLNGKRGCQDGILSLADLSGKRVRDLKGKRGCQVGILNLRDLKGKRG